MQREWIDWHQGEENTREFWLERLLCVVSTRGFGVHIQLRHGPIYTFTLWPVRVILNEGGRRFCLGFDTQLWKSTLLAISLYLGGRKWLHIGINKLLPYFVLSTPTIRRGFNFPWYMTRKPMPEFVEVARE